MAEVNLEDYFGRMNGTIQQYHGAAVWFEYILEKDEAESLAEGRPIHKEVLKLNVHFPGTDHTVVNFEEKHKFEYKTQYDEFMAREAEPVKGTHLKEWTLIPRSIAEELKFFHIKTVEQLSEFTVKEDEIRQRFIKPWQKRARKFLEASKDAQNKVVHLSEVNEKLEARIKKNEEQILLLLQRIESSEGVRLINGANGSHI